MLREKAGLEQNVVEHGNDFASTRLAAQSTWVVAFCGSEHCWLVARVLLLFQISGQACCVQSSGVAGWLCLAPTQSLLPHGNGKRPPTPAVWRAGRGS